MQGQLLQIEDKPSVIRSNYFMQSWLANGFKTISTHAPRVQCAGSQSEVTSRVSVHNILLEWLRNNLSLFKSLLPLGVA